MTLKELADEFYVASRPYIRYVVLVIGLYSIFIGTCVVSLVITQANVRIVQTIVIFFPSVTVFVSPFWYVWRRYRKERIR